MRSIIPSVIKGFLLYAHEPLIAASGSRGLFRGKYKKIQECILTHE